MALASVGTEEDARLGTEEGVGPGWGKEGVGPGGGGCSVGKGESGLMERMIDGMSC